MGLPAIIDTNVVGYLLLGTPPFLHEVEPFWSVVTDAAAPAHWQAELANVIWLALRADLFAAPRAQERLAEAAELKIESVPVPSLWEGALGRSTASGIAIYDTLFVELAVQRRCPLATFDKAVLRAFPDIAARPRDLL